jgi:hypothetical protein
MADSMISGLSAFDIALGDLFEAVDISDTTIGAGGSNRKITAQRLGGFILRHVVCGRLTLESGVAVSTSDQTGKTNVYFTPYNGNGISIYDGTRWLWYTFSELTLALGTLTSGKNYDVFVYDNSGTLTLESLVWTDDTNRATAITLQDGIYCKNGALTRRYLGTFRTTSTTTTEDSGAPAAGTTPKRFLWNLYNRVPRRLRAIENADSWTYTSSTWRSANNDATNRLEYVVGLDIEPVKANTIGGAFNNTTASNNMSGVGVDSTSANSAQLLWSGSSPTANTILPSRSEYSGNPGIGYHYLQWLEMTDAGSGTVTFYGDVGVSYIQSGIIGEVWG